MVGILVFIHHHIAPAPLILLEDVGIFTEQGDGIAKEIVEIHCVGIPQAFLIGRICLRHLFDPEVLTRLGSQFLWGKQPVLGAADFGQDRLVPEHLFFDVQGLHAFLHQAAAVVGIIDGEMGGEAQPVAVTAENPCAQGVEGAGRHFAPILPKHPLQPLFELTGGFVGEGDGQDPPGRTGIHGQTVHRGRIDRGGAGSAVPQMGQVVVRQGDRHLRAVVGPPVFDKAGDTVDQHRRFAAAGSGQDKERAVGVKDSLALRIVHPGEIPFHDPAAKRAEFLIGFRHRIPLSSVVTGPR